MELPDEYEASVQKLSKTEWLSTNSLKNRLKAIKFVIFFNDSKPFKNFVELETQL